MVSNGRVQVLGSRAARAIVGQAPGKVLVAGAQQAPPTDVVCVVSMLRSFTAS